jgi:hypothetical protein
METEMLHIATKNLSKAARISNPTATAGTVRTADHEKPENFMAAFAGGDRFTARSGGLGSRSSDGLTVTANHSALRVL